MASPRLLMAATRGMVAQRAFHASVLRSEVTKSALEVTLRDGLKAAMKSKDKPATACLKSILADITYNAKSSPNPSEPLAESAVMNTIRKAIQSRTQAAESYAPGTPAHHPENHQNLQDEIKLLQSYLPTSPSLESISGLISEILSGLSEDVKSSRSVQGSVMKTLWEKLGEGAAAVDRKEIGKLVSEALKK